VKHPASTTEKEMRMASNDLVGRRGAILDLGACVVGKNLNLSVLRGYAGLDVLADISSPDIYDMKDNPNGTQRDLKQKHAEECFEYAMDAVEETPEDVPCCFPEIMLNARDINVIEVYNIADPSEFLDFTSFSETDDLPSSVVGLRIRVSDLEFPKVTKGPQISRVDGNHRLSKVDDLLRDPDFDINDPDGPEFPELPFSLLIGLNQGQEARLFRDVNGEHVGMETAHLDSLMIRIHGEAGLKADKQLRPLWFAHQLTQDGRAFDGQVFFGGSKAGVKKAGGGIPPIKINALKAAIVLQMRSAQAVSVLLDDEPDPLLVILDRYWQAVKETFPEEWQDRKDYILMQSIGLNAFAKFGGILLDRAWADEKVELDDFKHVLQAVKNKVSLERKAWPGTAGAGGANVVAEALVTAAEPSDVASTKNMASLNADVPPAGLSLDS
jgi:DGQHR domain-containing protein